MSHADVAIVGGGIVGCSVAYHLRQDGFTGRIVIVERDDSYARSSSNLAMGGIRQQFESTVNIEMVRYSVAFYQEFDERMRTAGCTPRAWFRQRGYLFLADAASSNVLERRWDVMRERGANVRRLSVDEIRTMVPDLWLDDILFGVFGPDDGYANPKEVLRGFRAGAQACGAKFVCAEVVGIRRERDRVAGIMLSNGDNIEAPVVVNAGGPYAGVVATLAGIDEPVLPMRQHLFRCDLPRHWPYRFPMVIDPGGVHWRHDDPTDSETADRIVLAKTKYDEPPGENFVCDASRWLADFYPDLVRRVPVLKDVSRVEGWAGLYEMTPDHNPILGEHPDLRGFFMANGFSGHGLMMAPASGKVLSELIRTGRTETIDVSSLAVARFARGELCHDGATI